MTEKAVELTVVATKFDAQLKQGHEYAARTIAAWGTGGAFQYRGSHVRVWLGRFGPLHCLGETKGGYPKHPLYLPDSAETLLWQAKCQY